MIPPRMKPLSGPSTSALSSTSYLAGLKRYFWVPVLTAVLAGAIGYALAHSRSVEYSGRALLKIDDQNLTRTLLGVAPASAGSDPTAAAVALVPQVDQPETAARALKLLGRDAGDLTASKIQKQTSVSLDKDSALVAIEAKQPTADGAARLANAYANGYVDLRSDADLAQIRRSIRSLQTQYQKLRRTAATNPADQATAAQLGVRLQSLRLYEQTRPRSISLAKAATTPDGTAGISTKLVTLFAALLGLLLGLALVVAREQTDTRTRTPEDFEYFFGAPILARVPRSRKLGRRRPFHELAPREAEAFRVLLARLRNDRLAEDAKSVIVTSAAAREGKSTSSWYLATAAALSGVRTLLLEVDRARPSGLPPTPGADGTGVREILAGQRAAGDLVHRYEVEVGYGFEVIQAGRSHATAHLGDTDTVDQLMTWAEGEYDLVIVEAPPLPLAADAVPFAKRASAVVVIARSGKATAESSMRLKTIIDGLDADIAGVVTVGYDSANYYSY
jgi:Mrp family chromosome partitioning ATPase